jgi:hypothetical protein
MFRSDAAGFMNKLYVKSEKGAQSKNAVLISNYRGNAFTTLAATVVLA